MKRPRLIVSDVDGTIFDRKDTVTEGLKYLKQLLDENEVPFTLASGRCYSNMEKLIEYLGIKLPVIVNNGTGIVVGEKVCWSQKICFEAVREAIAFADSKGMLVSVCDAKNEWVVRHNRYVQSYVERFYKQYTYLLGQEQSVDEICWDKIEIQKVLIIDHQSPGRIHEVLRRLGDLSTLSVVVYDDRSADIMPRGCNKKKGLEMLSSLLEISMQEIIAIGDNANDKEMIESVGVGVGVKNAAACLKERVDYLCEKEGAAGVAEVVERFLTLEGEINK